MTKSKVPAVNYQRLAILTLAKALDDICPFDEFDHAEGDIRIGEINTQTEKIKDRIQKFELQEKELDEEWALIEKQAEDEWKKFLVERDSIFSRIEKTRNSERIKSRIKSYQTAETLRIQTIIKELEEEKKAYKARVTRFKERGRRYRPETVEKKLASMEKLAEGRIKSSRERYKRLIENTKAMDNAAHVEERLRTSKAIWARREKELKAKYELRVQNHNHKRIEQDQIRLAIEWFVYDVEKVNHFTTLAGITLLECYEAVKRRLALINRNSPEIERITDDIKSGRLELKHESFSCIKNLRK